MKKFGVVLGILFALVLGGFAQTTSTTTVKTVTPPTVKQPVEKKPPPPPKQIEKPVQKSYVVYGKGANPTIEKEPHN